MPTKKTNTDELLDFTFGELDKIVNEKSSELVDEKKPDDDQQQPEDRQENPEPEASSEKVGE